MSEAELEHQYEELIAELERETAGATATGDDLFGPPSWVEISDMIEDQERAIAASRQGILEKLAGEVVGTAGGVVTDLMRSFGDWLKREVALPLVESDIVPESVRPYMRQLVEAAGEGAIVPALLIAGVSIMARIGATFAVFASAEGQRAAAANPIDLPGVGELAAMVFRGLISETEGADAAARQGISATWWENLKRTATVLPDPDVCRVLYLRGRMSELEHDTYLEMQGFSSDAIVKLKQAYEWIPGPQDLVRMAVREAFSEEYSAAFRTTEDLPPPFVEYMQRQGATPEMAAYFWRAHWELPSVQMGFSMLHRKIIDRAQLEQLLVALDIMPWWREKLVQLSFRPLTRVDVRRMYRVGTLPTRHELVRAYEELGYSTQNAERMTDFTIRYETQKEKNLSKGEILKGYRKKVLSVDEGVTLLRQLGYDSAEAGFLLALEDVHEQEELEDLILDRIEHHYVTGVIDQTYALAELGELGIPALRAELLLNAWRQKKEMRRQLPTKADWLRWLAAGTASADEVKNELFRLGYDWSHAQRYIDEVLTQTET